MPYMSKSASTASVEIPHPATLLIVETDAVFREFEARTLSDRGYTVLKARGMAEALELGRCFCGYPSFAHRIAKSQR